MRLAGRYQVGLALLVVAAPVAAEASDRATGTHGAVAAEHRLASEAGLSVLRAGGNAVDAAVASALVTGVVNPSSSGIGGGGFMLVYIRRSQTMVGIDFRETAPRAARADMFAGGGSGQQARSIRGGTAVATPGEVAGLMLAHERFGSLARTEVFAPAIRLAREGFAVEAHLARALQAQRNDLAADPALGQTFLHADGRPYGEGETLRQPDLGATLEAVSASGPRAFYEGPIAGDIVAAVRRSGGELSLADLASYEIRERAPIITLYRGWRVAGMPPPASGGALVAEALGVLEPYALDDLGHGSVTYPHLLAETLKAVFADRAQHLGDPDFSAVPMNELLSSGHIAVIRGRLSAVRTIPAADYDPSLTARDGGTSHISVVDAAGNAVALTTSVNTGFGAKVGVPGRGIVLNNTMDDFSVEPGKSNVYGLVGTTANGIAPRKRPLSSMSPTIVLEADGDVRAVAGASGGPLIVSSTLQALLNLLDFEMSVDAAVDSARIHHQWLPDRTFVEDALPELVRMGLSRIGHDVRALESRAAVQLIDVRAERGRRTLDACSDGRKGGTAAAY